MNQLLATLDELTSPDQDVTSLARASASSEEGEADERLHSRPPSSEPLDNLISRLIQRLDELEQRLDQTPTRHPQIGHNNPPSEIGLPPYSDEDRWHAQIAIEVARAELARPEPSVEKLHQAESTLRKISLRVLRWTAKKLDLAVDQLIKAGITAAVAGGAFWLMLQAADDIADIAQQLLQAAL